MMVVVGGGGGGAGIGLAGTGEEGPLVLTNRGLAPHSSYLQSSS